MQRICPEHIKITCRDITGEDNGADLSECRLAVERLCITCGSTSEGDELCVHCGSLLCTPIEVVESASVGAGLVGTHKQPIVYISYLVAVVNFIVGPVVAFVTIFSPMLPHQIFRVVPLNVFCVSTLLVPTVALGCLGLNKLAKYNYKQTKHAPKNCEIALLSYKASVWSVLLWLTVGIVGIAVTLF